MALSEAERQRLKQLQAEVAAEEAAKQPAQAVPEIAEEMQSEDSEPEDTRPFSERLTEGAQAFGLGALETMTGVGVPAVLAAQDVIRGQAPEGYGKQQKMYEGQMQEFFKKSPVAAPVGQIAGAVLPGAAAALRKGAAMSLGQLAKVGAGEGAIGAIPRNIPTEDESALGSAGNVALQAGLSAAMPGAIAKAPAVLQGASNIAGKGADRLVPYATGMSAEQLKSLTKESFGKGLENIDFVSNYLRKSGVIKPGRSFEETAGNAIEAIKKKNKKFGKLVDLLDAEEMKYVQGGGTPNDMLGGAAQRIDEMAAEQELGKTVEGLAAAAKLREDAQRLRDIASKQTFGFQTQAPAGTPGLGSITLPKGATATTGIAPYQTQTTLREPLTKPREDLYGTSFRQIQNYINEFGELAPENSLKIAMEKAGLPLKERAKLKEAMFERAYAISPKRAAKLEEINRELAPLKAVKESLTESAASARAGKSGTSQTVVPYGFLSSQLMGRGASATMSALGAAERGLAGAATRSSRVKQALAKNPGLFGTSGQRLMRAIAKDEEEGRTDNANFNAAYFIESRQNPDLQNDDILKEE